LCRKIILVRKKLFFRRHLLFLTSFPTWLMYFPYKENVLLTLETFINYNIYYILYIINNNISVKMKKRGLVVCLLVISFILLINFISATSITDDLHVNIQTTNATGTIETGTFAFVFNVSTTENCANVIYTNSTSLTTDTRGIISYYLPDVTLDYDVQYWLCYYRDGALESSSKIAKTPYAFRAQNITLTGVEIDSNLDMGTYNVSASWFKGLFNWTVSTASNLWLSFTGSELSFNETNLNATINASIDLKASDLNVNQSDWWQTSEGYLDDVSDISGSWILNDLNWMNWTQIDNRTFAYVGEPFWTSNYTAYNTSWSSTYNATYQIGYEFVTNGTFMESSADEWVNESGDTMTGNLVMSGANITNVSYLGVGTSTPVADLEISKLGGSNLRLTDETSANRYLKVNTTEIRMVRQDASIKGFIIATENVGAWSSGNINSGDIIFKPNQTEALRIDQGGNVGIGSSSPNYKLEVAGDLNVSNNFFVDSSGRVGIGSASPQNALNVLGTGNVTSNFTVDETVLHVDATGDKVGVGTLGPRSTLEVAGAGGSDIRISNSQDVSKYLLLNQTYISMVRETASISGLKIQTVNTGAWGGTSTSDSGDIIFLPNASEAMRIDLSGNVGIGTSTPQNKLNVLGDANVTGTLYLNNNNVSDTYVPYTGALRNVVLGANNFSVNTNTIFVNKENSRVGIGTVSPSSDLEIAKTDGANLRVSDVVENKYLELNNSNIFMVRPDASIFALTIGTRSVGDWSSGNINSGDIIFKPNNTEALRIDAGGNVGIGTNNPQNKLNVLGDINATTNIYGNVLYEAGVSLVDKYYLATNPSVFWNTTYYGGIGNWTLDKPNYYTSAQVNALPISTFTNDNSYYNSTSLQNISQLVNDNSYYNSTSLTMPVIQALNFYNTTEVNDINNTQASWVTANYVPYSGANSNTDLGIYNLTTTGRLTASVINATSLIYQNNNLVLDTATSFGGDVSGNYNSIVVADDSHLHDAANITNEYWVNESGDTMTGTLNVNANLSVNTNTLFVNSNSGRVGIGTTSPNTLLTLNQTPGELSDNPTLSFGDGDTGFYETIDDTLDLSIATVLRYSWSDSAFTGTTNYGFSLLRGVGSAATPSYSFVGDEDTGIYRDTADYLRFSTGATHRMTIDDSGNVGISTTNPQNTLNVVGDGNFTTALYVNEKNLETAYDFATNGTYYLNTNPFGFYNSTSLTTNSQLANGNNYWNDTFATFNKTYADTIYAPTGYGDDWNKTYADTLYYDLGNSFGFYNSTSLQNISQLANDNSYYNSTTAPIYINDTFAGNYSTYLTLFNWNKTYADTLYASIGYGDDWNKTYADTLYYDLGNSFGFYNSTSLQNISQLANDNSYYNSTTLTTNSQLLNTNNYWNDTFATFNKTYADTLYYDLGNSFSYYNSSSLTMSVIQDLNFYNTTQVDAINLSMANYVEATYLRNDGDNGTGEYNFGGRYLDGGVTIKDGAIYAQTGYFYNITSLAITHLDINGSILPTEGYDNDFDLGSGSLRWRNLYVGTNAYVNGTIYQDGNAVLDARYNSLSNFSNDLGIGNWTADKPNYINATTLDNASIIRSWNTSWITTNVGNWTEDKSSYYNTTQIETNFTNYYNISQVENNFTNYFTASQILDLNYYNSTSLQNVSQLANDFSYYNTTSLTMFVIQDKGFYNTTQIETNFTNYYNTTEVDSGFATIDEPLWTSNYSAYNDSWSSTYNSSYQAGYEYTTNDTFVPYTGAVKNVELGDNNFSVNGTTLFVDSSSGNVGVGTTSPQNKLNVIGEGNFTGDLYSSGDIFALNSSLSDYYLKANLFGFYNSSDFNISDYATNVKVDSLGNWTLDKQYYYNKTQIENNFTSYFTKTQVLGFDYYNSTNYPNIVDGSGTYGYIPMWNGTNSINNSEIYQNGTNVGIGTTSPSQKLEVEGNVNITQNLTIGGATVFTQGEDMIFRI